MAVTNGSGLVIIPKSTGTIAAGTLTAPAVKLTLAQLIAAADPAMRLRLWVYNPSNNSNANYDSMIAGVYDGTANNGYVIYRGRNTAKTVFPGGWINGSGVYGAQVNVGSLDSTNDCVVLDIEQLNGLKVIGYYGAMGAGGAWPTIGSLTWANAARIGGSGAAATSSVGANPWSLLLGAQRNGAATALSITIAKVRVDYRI
jgi:hypothetical protein